MLGLSIKPHQIVHLFDEALFLKKKIGQERNPSYTHSENVQSR